MRSRVGGRETDPELFSKGHVILDGELDMLAIDPGYGAGVDDVVIVAREGAVVKQLMNSSDVPANVIILGVVDGWSAEA